MSKTHRARFKAFLPGTHVIGASPVLDRNEKTNRIEPVIAATTMRNVGHGDTPYVRQGDPMWRKPKPMGFVQHFRNEASARRCGGDMKLASPKDLKIVPLYRGVSSRLANEIISAKRRAKRIAEERAAAKGSLLDRAKAALGLGADDGTQYS